MTAIPTNRYVVFLAISLAGLWVDLFTKSWVFDWLGMPSGQVYWIVPGYFGLETSLNEGALFGMGQGKIAVFVSLSLLALLGIAYWLFVKGYASDWLLTIALGAVTAGILGNLYDRLGMHGLQWNYPADRVGDPVYAVRDWILWQANDQWRWPNFNIADSLLVCGAIALTWHAWFYAEPAQKPQQTSSAP
ncbi:MAG: signal peptidase II [Planctomycetales bacterium]|nr:signal peptidase II [Planctomycetales bacterium]